MGETSLAPLSEGDVIRIDVGTKVYAASELKLHFPEFDNDNALGDRDISEAFTAEYETITSAKKAGHYVVLASKSYKCICCRKLLDDGQYDPDGRLICFPQNGLRPRPPVLRRMTRVYV